MRQTIVGVILILAVCAAVLVPRERPPAEVDCVISICQGRMRIIYLDGENGEE